MRSISGSLARVFSDCCRGAFTTVNTALVTFLQEIPGPPKLKLRYNIQIEKSTEIQIEVKENSNSNVAYKNACIS